MEQNYPIITGSVGGVGVLRAKLLVSWGRFFYPLELTEAQLLSQFSKISNKMELLDKHSNFD